jgi:hypothetical protein
MKILRRQSPVTESIDGHTAGGTQVYRRIEIMQEREIVSVLVHGRPGATVGKSAEETAWPELVLPEWPPGEVEKPDRNRP